MKASPKPFALSSALLLIALGLGLTCLPYLYALRLAYQTDSVFMGYLHYPDDAYVYHSWMRQAREGKWLFKDLFTTDPHTPFLFNLLFLLLGLIQRWFPLNDLFYAHLVRLFSGAVFLLLCYQLILYLLPNPSHQQLAFLTLLFSSGLGWLFSRQVPYSPIDLWQTEAITFLCIYQSFLFLFSLTLMVLYVFWFLRSEQEERWCWAIGAGFGGLLLADIHPYDILHLWAVLGGYFCWSLRQHPEGWLSRLLKILPLFFIPLPAVGYNYWLFLREPLFRARALVPTGSAPLPFVLLGYGLLLPLAGWGYYLLSRSEDQRESRRIAPFLAIWALVGLLLPYVPLSFQRKLIMGAHIPLALLAGVGLEALLRRWPIRRHLALLLVVILLGATNWRWLVQGFKNAQENNTEPGLRPFLMKTEWQAMKWLEKEGAGGGVLALPLTGVAGYLPAVTGLPTYAGHWGETPQFAQRLRRVLAFYQGEFSLEERRDFLQRIRVRWVFYGPAERSLPRVKGDWKQGLPLRLRYRGGEGVSRVEIYEVRASPYIPSSKGLG